MPCIKKVANSLCNVDLFLRRYIMIIEVQWSTGAGDNTLLDGHLTVVIYETDMYSRKKRGNHCAIISLNGSDDPGWICHLQAE